MPLSFTTQNPRCFSIVSIWHNDCKLVFKLPINNTVGITRMDNETNAQNSSHNQKRAVERESIETETPSTNQLPGTSDQFDRGKQAGRQESVRADRETVAWLTTCSFSFLLTTSAVVGLYLYLFGHHLFSGDTPDYWNWMGGIVGLIAVLIRVAVILMLFIPHTVLSVMGISMSARAISKSEGLTVAFNSLLVVCHSIMLLPSGFIAFNVLFR